MAGHPARSLEADVERNAEGATIQVRSANLDRVDAYIDQRPIGSQDVLNGRCSFRVPHAVIGHTAQLRLEGFERGDLEAVRRLTIP
jgi:hypothetical protein